MFGGCYSNKYPMSITHLNNTIADLHLEYPVIHA